MKRFSKYGAAGNPANRRVTARNSGKDLTKANLGQGLELKIESRFSEAASRGVYIAKQEPKIKIQRAGGQITGAFPASKSGLDYIGCYQGMMFTFDAKETQSKTNFPLANIKEHQIETMLNVQRAGGVAFIVVGFDSNTECYALPFEYVMKWWDGMKAGGRKSIPRDDIHSNCSILSRGMFELDWFEYIECVFEGRRVQCL